MVRVAARGARFLLLVPNADFPPLRLGLYGGTDQSSVREELRSLEGWRELFESAGLTIVKRWRDLHVLSISWITRGPWYFWPLSWQYQVYYHCSLKK